jgi:prolyl-tRNA editing enzyme YbaK/EbsC (Cys-tRNA(Pro) deacylase)
LAIVAPDAELSVKRRLTAPGGGLSDEAGMGENLLERETVRRVQAALAAAGGAAQVVALGETARSAADAARAIGCPIGAIVKSLVFVVGEQPVLALIAGDRRCDPAALARLFGVAGAARRADADEVRTATGFAIGGVAPVGHLRALPVALDASLNRFRMIYAAAGHPRCVFATSATELARLTGARVSDSLAVA